MFDVRRSTFIPSPGVPGEGQGEGTSLPSHSRFSIALSPSPEYPISMIRTLLLPFVSALFFLTPAFAAADEAFTPLFNGKDLSNWVNVNCAPTTWSVRDGIIHCTGIPTGLLRTDRMYENYILELEWKHLKKGGNAGLFVHSAAITARGQPFSKAIEVQIIDANHPKGFATSHGDVFAIHGATFVPDRPHPDGWMRCLPSEHRAKPAGEWNHYRVECRDGKISLAVNGKVVSGGTKCIPRKGYIVLESEGSDALFKNIRIHELPSSNPPAAEVAEADEGYKSLYTGVDLSGWKAESGNEAGWKPKDWTLTYAGTSDARGHELSSEKRYRNLSLIVDWQLKGEASEVPITLRGKTPSAGKAARSGQWNRALVTVKDDRMTVLVNDQVVMKDEQLADHDGESAIVLKPAPGIAFANIYVKDLSRP